MRPAAIALAASLALPVAARGQQPFAAPCAQLGAGLANVCFLQAQAAFIAQPRLALALAGGNPIPGSASTLGFRIGTSPRIAGGLRATATRMTIPNAATGGQISAMPVALGLDLGAGVLDGFSPASTVGGVGSVDLLASAGWLPHVGGGFQGTPFGLGAGLRVGILRESFTVPGIAISGMFRHVGGTSFLRQETGVGVPAPTERFDLGSTTDWSLRAVVGKRLMTLNTAAGIGLDRVSSDVTLGPICLVPVGGSSCSGIVVGPERLTQTRPGAFASLTWIALVLSGTAEVGWQKGGSPADLAPPTGGEGLVRKGALFGSLSLRLTI